MDWDRWKILSEFIQREDVISRTNGTFAFLDDLIGDLGWNISNVSNDDRLKPYDGKGI